MKSFIVAAQFLTRLPLPHRNDVSEAEFGKSQQAFVVVALLTGLMMAAVYWFFQYRLPPLLLGVVILLVEIIINGGLLLDGFMDTSDGIFSAKPRERALEIMKDSRVGAHSVTTVVLLFMTKFAVYASLPMVAQPYLFLILAPMVGKWFMLFVITFYPYARQEGIGKFFKDQSQPVYFYFSSLLVGITAWILAPGWTVFFAILLTFLLSMALASKINAFLLGQTGDTYGALSETSQALFMLVLFIF